MDRCRIPAADLSMKNNLDEREQHIRPIKPGVDQKMKNGEQNEAAKHTSKAI